MRNLPMKGSDRLFRCGDQIFLFITGFTGFVIFAHDLMRIERMVSLSLPSLTLPCTALHRIDSIVPLLASPLCAWRTECKEFRSFCHWACSMPIEWPLVRERPQVPTKNVDHRSFEIERRYLHKITTWSSNGCSALTVVTIDHIHQIKMWVFLSCFDITRCTFSLVVFLNRSIDRWVMRTRVQSSYFIIADRNWLMNDVSDFIQSFGSIIFNCH